jgi:hypothetical protein
MPKNAFPIGSNYPVTFARNWHWRVDQLGADDGTSYRLLTGFNRHIEDFASWLAEDTERNPFFLRDTSFTVRIRAGIATRPAMTLLRVTLARYARAAVCAFQVAGDSIAHGF